MKEVIKRNPGQERKDSLVKTVTRKPLVRGVLAGIILTTGGLGLDGCKKISEPEPTPIVSITPRVSEATGTPTPKITEAPKPIATVAPTVKREVKTPTPRPIRTAAPAPEPPVPEPTRKPTPELLSYRKNETLFAGQIKDLIPGKTYVVEGDVERLGTAGEVVERYYDNRAETAHADIFKIPSGSPAERIRAPWGAGFIELGPNDDPERTVTEIIARKRNEGFADVIVARFPGSNPNLVFQQPAIQQPAIQQPIENRIFVQADEITLRDPRFTGWSSESFNPDGRPTLIIGDTDARDTAHNSIFARNQSPSNGQILFAQGRNDIMINAPSGAHVVRFPYGTPQDVILRRAEQERNKMLSEGRTPYMYTLPWLPATFPQPSVAGIVFNPVTAPFNPNVPFNPNITFNTFNPNVPVNPNIFFNPNILQPIPADLNIPSEWLLGSFPIPAGSPQPIDPGPYGMIINGDIKARRFFEGVDQRLHDDSQYTGLDTFVQPEIRDAIITADYGATGWRLSAVGRQNLYSIHAKIEERKRLESNFTVQRTDLIFYPGGTQRIGF